MRTWYLRFLLAIVMVFSVVAPAQADPARQQESTRLTILHDTHLHGAFDGQDRVTLAHFVGLVKSIRANQPNTLFLGNGDDLAPSLYSAAFKGEHMVAALNQAGLDANTFGSHEFDYGPDNLRQRIQESAFPWVSANVLDRQTGDAFGADLGVQRFLVLEVGGVWVGITGFAPAETADLSSPGPDVEVLDPIQAAQEIVPRMREAGAQIVVVLSHLGGPAAEELAAAVSGIDVIVGDHDSAVLAQPKVVNGAIVARRGDGIGLLGQLDLELREGRIASWSYTAHKLSATAPVDEAVAEVIAQYKSALDEALGVEVGWTDTPLDATREASRSRETGLGNLIADALREWAQADVGLQNGGGIRSEKIYEPGPLTKRDLAAILPFSNYGAKVRVSGQALRAALELSVGSVQDRHGRFLQVSGLELEYNPLAPAGSRVRKVLVGGSPLDEAALYTVALNDFMQRGGDGYTMLAKGEVLIPGQAGELVANVLAGYVAARGTVAPQVEGRIVSAPVQEQPAAPAAVPQAQPTVAPTATSVPQPTAAPAPTAAPQPTPVAPKPTTAPTTVAGPVWTRGLYKIPAEPALWEAFEFLDQKGYTWVLASLTKRPTRVQFTTSSSDDFWGQYQPRNNLVLLSQDLRGASKQGVAAILIHEVTHVQDVQNGRITSVEQCISSERKAFEAEATFWRSLWGSTGKPSPDSAYERFLNVLARVYPAYQTQFDSIVAQSYRSACSAILG